MQHVQTSDVVSALPVNSHQVEPCESHSRPQRPHPHPKDYQLVVDTGDHIEASVPNYLETKVTVKL